MGGRGAPFPPRVTRLAGSYTCLLVVEFVGGHARVCMSHHRLYRRQVRITPHTITQTLSVTPSLTLTHSLSPISHTHILKIALKSHYFLLMVRYRTRVRLSHPNMGTVYFKLKTVLQSRNKIKLLAHFHHFVTHNDQFRQI